MEKLTRLVDDLLSAKAEVDALEEQLKQAKGRYNEYSQHKIPEYMLANNIEHLRLKDGTNVSISRDLSARALDMQAVGEFLQEHNAEHLMQTMLDLGHVTDEQAQTIAAHVADKFQIYPELSKKIHSQKLKAFIRELCLGDGSSMNIAELPESIGVYVFYTTKIK